MICRIYDVQGGTLDQYDEVSNMLGTDKPDGAHAHLVGATDGGFKVIEVWDSEDHVNRYAEEVGLGPALQEAQVPEPKITQFEVHNLEWLG